MKLDYGTQISPSPITLSIGTLRKPTLREISDISFDKFDFYRFLSKMTPKIFFTVLQKDNDGEQYWNVISDKRKKEMTMFEIISNDTELQNLYCDMLNFFFVEDVIFANGYFILTDQDSTDDDRIQDKLRGAISGTLFDEVMDVIQQICCVKKDEKDEAEEEPKFKNALAKRMYEKMKKPKHKKKQDENLTLPNLISALSSKHPSLNYTNIWDLTVFQLTDTFNRTLVNSMYEIDATRVSVWGDEKNTFEPMLWYKNEFDKNSDRS